MSKKDVLSELFSRPVLHAGPIGAGGVHSSLRMVRYVPAHFEVVDFNPEVKIGSIFPRAGDSDFKSDADFDRHAEKNKGRKRWVSPESAGEIVETERRRRQLWAMLSDHVLGVAEHDLNEIKAELNSDFFGELVGAATNAKRLMETSGDDQVREVRDRLQKFESENSEWAISDSRHLTDRHHELKNAVEFINENRRELRRLQERFPLLFQSPEDRAKFHPSEKSNKKPVIEAETAEAVTTK